jgi:hypothetical protein
MSIVFRPFRYDFFVIVSLMKSNLIFLHIVNIILMGKVDGAYETSVHFGWRFVTDKNDFSSCHWNRLYILFMLVQRMSATNEKISKFFFEFFFL